MNFEEIQKKAAADWATLEDSPKPQIVVGAATCGRAAGALAVLDTIKSELARQAGVSVLTIDRIEKGKSCRMETKRKILTALGIDFSESRKIFMD